MGVCLHCSPIPATAEYYIQVNNGQFISGRTAGGNSVECNVIYPVGASK